jgi:CRP-like cAMP-binding protein
MGRLLVVLSGETELIGLDDDGSALMRGFGPGDFVGELALLSEQRFPGALRATTPLCLLALARSDFLAVAANDHELQRAVLGHLARRRSALASAASASGVEAPRVLSP